MPARQSVTIERFPGLNLADDPTEVGFNGALNLLNVEYRGRQPRARPTGAHWTELVIGSGYGALHAIGDDDAAPDSQVFAARGSGTGVILDAFNTGGYIDASSSTYGASTHPSAIRFVTYGTPADTYVFACDGGGGTSDFIRYDPGALAWAIPSYTGTGSAPDGSSLAVTPWDNRLVSAFESTVRFSDEGDPLNWESENEVSLNPGDGEWISDICVWNDQMFVFKQTKYFVFYGVSTDSTGGAVFEYRLGGSLGTAGSETKYDTAPPRACVGPDGVYFYNRDGVYRTRGSNAELVSAAIGPVFSGSGNLENPYSFLSTETDPAPLGIWSVTSRIFLSLSALSDRPLMVLDTNNGSWSRWVLPGGHRIEGITPLPRKASDTDVESPFLYAGTAFTVDDIYLCSHATGRSAATGMDGVANSAWKVSATGGTSGTFTLTFQGQTTGTIAWNAGVGTVLSAIEALSNVDVGDFEVICYEASINLGPMYIVPAAGEQYENVASLSLTLANDSVASVVVTVTEDRDGGPGSPVDVEYVTGASDFGYDGRKVIVDGVLSATDGAYLVEVAPDLTAHADSVGKQLTFTDFEALACERSAVNKRGRVFSVRVRSDTGSAARTVFYPHRLTLTYGTAPIGDKTTGAGRR